MFKNLLRQALQEKKREEGQGLVEYALILVLVAVVVIVVLSLIGPSIGNIFSGVVGALNGNIASSDTATGPVECLGDLAPPTEYYNFVGDPVLANPVQWYSDANCSTVGGTNNITIIHPSLSEAEADAICQDLYSVDANVNGPGDIWYCS